MTPQTPVPKLSVKKTDYRFAEICKKKRRSREVIIVNRRSAVHLHQRPVGRRDAPLLSIRLGPGVSYLSALVLSLSLSLLELQNIVDPSRGLFLFFSSILFVFLCVVAVVFFVGVVWRSHRKGLPFFWRINHHNQNRTAKKENPKMSPICLSLSFGPTRFHDVRHFHCK